MPSTARLTPAITVEIPGGMGEVEVTIDYTYDSLYRLTAADYDDGTYFHYTYDAVGNRLTEETDESASIYTYDIANRLTDVDGVTYTWDANGNLLADGTSTYTYDAANRLTGLVQDGDSYTYTYNGLGDRLSQTVNGETTNYTLDINTYLTEVLQDGDSTYLYGLGRISEDRDETTLYHLPDALGSVRQLADSESQILLAQSYEPFGDVLETYGADGSTYGFTGQMVDENGLVYLRARYYDTGTGRFFTKDPWNGSPTQPMSYDPYLYAYNNPIVYTDPSGQFCVAGFDIGPWGEKCTEEDRQQAAASFEYWSGFVTSPNFALGFAYELIDSMMILGPETLSAIVMILMNTEIGRTLQTFSYVALPFFLNDCMVEKLNDSQMIDFIDSLLYSKILLSADYYFQAGRASGRATALGMGIGVIVGEVCHFISSLPSDIMISGSGGVAGIALVTAYEAINVGVLAYGTSIVGSIALKEVNDSLLMNYFSGGRGNREYRPFQFEDLPDKYVPPKTGARRVTVQSGPLTGRKGWLDKKGNIWVPSDPLSSHIGPHWDVQLKGGGYANIPPRGN